MLEISLTRKFKCWIGRFALFCEDGKSKRSKNFLMAQEKEKSGRQSLTLSSYRTLSPNATKLQDCMRSCECRNLSSNKVLVNSPNSNRKSRLLRGTRIKIIFHSEKENGHGTHGEFGFCLSSPQIAYKSEIHVYDENTERNSPELNHEA